MDEEREKPAEDTKKTARGNIEQPTSEPVDREDPIEPIKVNGAKESKGTTM